MKEDDKKGLPHCDHDVEKKDPVEKHVVSVKTKLASYPRAPSAQRLKHASATHKHTYSSIGALSTTCSAM